MKHIFLIGFMGSGKSTVARRMRNGYGFQLIEMDQAIEKEQGMRISDIFQKYGEEYFRDLETSYLKKIEQEEACVVSCGGGVALRKENVEIMQKCGMIVWLNASPQIILERVKRNDKRPLLRNRKTIEDITAMMEARRPIYENAAQLVVTIDGKESRDVAKEIVERIKEIGE